jgi:ketosteroid isomerase-like protein
MKHRFVLAILLVFSQSAVYGAQSSKAEQEIRKLDDQRIAAILKEDIPMLDRLMTDDFTYTHQGGVVDTKADFLGAMKAGTWAYKSLNLSDVKVRFAGNAAILTGRCDMTGLIGGRNIQLAMHFTEVYARTGGHWHWLLWQSTRLPAHPPA